MFRTEISLDSLDFGKLEAVLELAALAARADGVIDETERVAFRTLVMERSNGKLGAAMADVIFAKLSAATAESTDARLARVRSRLPDARMRESALLLAANLVLADGALHVDEGEFLLRAGTVLEIGGPTVQAIVAQARLAR